MSVVSAGGRRGPHRDHRGDPRDPRDPRGGGQRDFRLLKNRGRGYSQSDVGEPFIPRFSAIASEGVKLQLPPEEWAETTTVLTGVTNDSYTGEDVKKVYDPPIGRVVSRRCSRVLWLTVASVIASLAVLSPSLMCLLPVLLSVFGYSETGITCEVDCQGYLLLVGIKTVLLAVAIWALYWRRAVADFPRLYVARAALAMFTLFVLFAFWLFYTVRILIENYNSYTYTVNFSLSLLDALLYTHYISVIVLELRKQRVEYTITIVRDPDGESHTVSTGMMSLQEAAIHVLRYYETNFSSFNGSWDKARFGGSMRRQGGQSSVGAGFKMYDIEGLGAGHETISQVNTRALFEAAARRRIPGHSEIMQEEVDWDRRLKKRKYRLMAAAEDAFAHVQAVQESQQTIKGISEPMLPSAAADSVFTFVARPLTKFLKLTRQQQKHSAESIKQHIERCLRMRLSYRTFLQRYFTSRFPITDVLGESKWSIICDEQASVSIKHGSTFLLRSHNKDDNAGIQLLCTVSSLSFFNLTEQPVSSMSKFALKISSESSV